MPRYTYVYNKNIKKWMEWRTTKSRIVVIPEDRSIMGRSRDRALPVLLAFYFLNWGVSLQVFEAVFFRPF